MNEKKEIEKKIDALCETLDVNMSRDERLNLKRIALIFNLPDSDPFLSILVTLNGYFSGIKRYTNNFRKYIFIAIFSFFILLSIVSYMSFKIGQSQICLDDETVSYIKFMAKNGDLDAIIKCNKPGWSIIDGNCYPSTYINNGKEVIAGWETPWNQSEK